MLVYLWTESVSPLGQQNKFPWILRVSLGFYLWIRLNTFHNLELKQYTSIIYDLETLLHFKIPPKLSIAVVDNLYFTLSFNILQVKMYVDKITVMQARVHT